MKISVNCPSYKRPKVETLKYLPFCKVWVAESEAEEYRKANPGANIISVPDKVQGNLCRVRNWILDHDDSDVVCLIDDDMRGMGYFEKNEIHKIETDQFLPFLEKYSALAKQLDVRIWGVNVNSDKKCYREYTPFSFTAYIGGPFSCHLDSPIRYDEKLPLKEDYDLSLQHLNKFRKVLRVNKFHYNVKQAEQVGGCASYRNLDRELDQMKMLQKKWGTKIVKFDSSDWSKKSSRKKIDINPILHIPIPGV